MPCLYFRFTFFARRFSQRAPCIQRKSTAEIASKRPLPNRQYCSLKFGLKFEKMWARCGMKKKMKSNLKKMVPKKRPNYRSLGRS